MLMLLLMLLLSSRGDHLDLIRAFLRQQFRLLRQVQELVVRRRTEHWQVASLNTQSMLSTGNSNDSDDNVEVLNNTQHNRSFTGWWFLL